MNNINSVDDIIHHFKVSQLDESEMKNRDIYKDVIKDASFESLFINNMNLLQYKEHQFFDKKYGLYQGCFKQSKNPTYFYLFCLNFLIEQFQSQSQQYQSDIETQTLLIYFPPKNQSDVNQYKQQAVIVLKELEKESKIPKDFFVGKSVLEFLHPNSSIQFLYFLSEFALRYSFLENFPEKTLKQVNLNRCEKMEEQTDHQNWDISFVYNQFSYNKMLKNSQEEIEEQCVNTYVHLMMEHDKHKKILEKQLQYQEYVQKEANKLTKIFQEAREKNVNLNQEFKKVQEDIPQEYFEENRGHDRKQQIDKSIQVIQELREIQEFMNDNDVVSKIRNYKSDTDDDSVLNSISREDLIQNNNSSLEQKQQEQFISLNRMWKNFNDKLVGSEKEIRQEEYRYNTEFVGGFKDELKSFRKKMQEQSLKQQQLLEQSEKLFQD